MQIAFLSSSDEDVRWFFRYYRKVFPEGSRRARHQMTRTLALLKHQPRIGKPALETGQLRVPISGTPFLLTYRLNEDRIEILRVFDGRANPARLEAEGADPS